MRPIGLEPTRCQSLDPKSSASTNFATSADGFPQGGTPRKTIAKLSVFAQTAKTFRKILGSARPVHARNPARRRERSPGILHWPSPPLRGHARPASPTSRRRPQILNQAIARKECETALRPCIPRMRPFQDPGERHDAVRVHIHMPRCLMSRLPWHQGRSPGPPWPPHAPSWRPSSRT